MFNRLQANGFSIADRNHAGTILHHKFRAAENDIEESLLGLSLPISWIIGSGGGLSKPTQMMREAFEDHGWDKKNYAITKVISETVNEPIVTHGSTGEVTIKSEHSIVNVVTDQSHEIDHAKDFDESTIALEIEWNNKDTFFARDLSTFRQLYQSEIIEMGIIVTRSAGLQASFKPFVEQYAKNNSIQSVGDLRAADIKVTDRQAETINSRVGNSRAGSDEASEWTFEASWADLFVNDKYAASTTHWDKLMQNVAKRTAYPCPIILIGLPPSIIDQTS